MSLFNADEATRAKRLDGLKKIGKALVGAGLPALGTAVAGPAGGMVAANVVRSLGLGAASSEEEIERAIAEADPTVLVELRKYEAEILTAQYEAQNVEQQEVTKRHGQDMLSDSVLSKNIRPILCGFFAVAFVAFLFWVGFFIEEITQNHLWLGLQIGGILGIALKYYFGGRTEEKKEKIQMDAKTQLFEGGLF